MISIEVSATGSSPPARSAGGALQLHTNKREVCRRLTAQHQTRRSDASGHPMGGTTQRRVMGQPSLARHSLFERQAALFQRRNHRPPRIIPFRPIMFAPTSRRTLSDKPSRFCAPFTASTANGCSAPESPATATVLTTSREANTK